MFGSRNDLAGNRLRDLPGNLANTVHHAGVAAERAERHLGVIAAEVQETSELARVALVFITLAVALYAGRELGTIARAFLR